MNKFAFVSYVMKKVIIVVVVVVVSKYDVMFCQIMGFLCELYMKYGFANSCLTKFHYKCLRNHNTKCYRHPETFL
jgi:hypothetical protein